MRLRATSSTTSEPSLLCRVAMAERKPGTISGQLQAVAAFISSTCADNCIQSSALHHRNNLSSRATKKLQNHYMTSS